jgi:hypothetical protein
VTGRGSRSVREHPFRVRRESDGIALTKPYRSAPICLPQENRSLRSSSLSTFMKQHLFAIRGQAGQHSTVEPGEFLLLGIFGIGEKDFALTIVDSNDRRAIGGDIV